LKQNRAPLRGAGGGKGAKASASVSKQQSAMCSLNIGSFLQSGCFISLISWSLKEEVKSRSSHSPTILKNIVFIHISVWRKK
jgi:hypothetical protein